MSFYRSNIPLSYDYVLNDCVLEKVNTVLIDLGVTFGKTSSFVQHVHNINTKALRSIMLVIPILTYCSVVWCPHINLLMLVIN